MSVKKKIFFFTASCLGALVIYVSTSIIHDRCFASMNVNSGQIGIASWYGKRFHGRRTACGERYDMFELTAAHRTLPLGTVVKVTNLSNNKQVTVRINDRGPYFAGRVIDLSLAAACELRMVKKGITKVKVEVLARKI
jgi:rare lipoprotein A